MAAGYWRLMAPYEVLYLYTTPENIYIQPVSDLTKVLTIDRITKGLTVYESIEPPQSACRRLIFGVVGIINLIAGPYLVFITERTKVGIVSEQDIFQIKQTELLSISNTDKHLNDQQKSLDRKYVSMVEKVLSTPFFYFSYAYDITHTMQRLYNISPEFFSQPMHKRADDRFVWNKHLLEPFSNLALVRFCLPIMHGFISINQCQLNGKTFLWTLISRRSCKRAGTRLFARGIDSHGNVANFVETEQIVEFEGYQSSFVQTRGSIPLFWQQYPNLKLKPSPKIIHESNHIEAESKHFDSQVFHYGRQVILNLVDHHGSEGAIEKAYRDSIRILNNELVQYEAFDFHRECRKMRWDRLQILIDRVAQTQDAFQSFLLLKKTKLVSEQEGVFRTNCIDCLDRTNVVQSMLARRSLGTVFKKLNICEPGEVEAYFENLFKQVWADNADYISLQYSGTGALKTDFTRTGKRTKAGMINDLKNSLIRYYKNNFQDGFRQDAIDLFTGNHKVNPLEGCTVKSPLVVDRSWKYIVFPMFLLISITMFFCNLIIPSEYTTKSLLSLLFWGSMNMITFSVTLRDGPLFVDRPRLYSRSITDMYYHKSVV